MVRATTLAGTPPLAGGSQFGIRITATDVAGASVASVFTLNAVAGDAAMRYSSTSASLGASERHLTLTGEAFINAYGNALNNHLTGNDAANTLDGLAGNDVLSGGGGNDSLYGGAGDDLLDGGAGADRMIGGTGNDGYWIDQMGDVVIEAAAEGNNDYVVSSIHEYNLAAHVETLYMTGAAYIGRGNDLNNTIVGTSGDNLIAGAGGADVMIGGTGNDGYWVEQAGDVVIEAAGEGNNDYVVSSIHEYNLAANVETLYMSGAAYIGRGNDLNNTIVGTSGDNLIAGAGGADVMIGGAGNDGYWVEQAGDVVIEAAAEGSNDYVVSSVHEYNLAANVETLYMSGNAIVGRGNELNNSLYGTAGNNHLDGGAGNDVLAGGAGSDTYYFGRGYGVDTIYENDATPGHADVLQMVGNVRSDQLWLRKAGNDLEIAVIGSADKAVVQNWYAGTQYRVEQIKTSSNQTLLHTQVDALVQAMAAFAPPVAGQSTLPANYQSALAPVIAASWN